MKLAKTAIPAQHEARQNRRSRAGGNPSLVEQMIDTKLDSRLRGNDAILMLTL